MDKIKDILPAVILAPMAGITSYPYRLLNRGFGCDFAFTEMIDVRSLTYNSLKTKAMLAPQENDSPLGVQILGEDESSLSQALDILESYSFKVIDFNAACPQKKVTSKGKGAALLRDLKKLSRLLKILVKKSKVPATVKIRLGWDESNSVSDLAKEIEDTGVSAIFVHGRTRMQFYRGSVDYQAISRVKKSVSIPVIASGDILSESLAKRMFDETGCDGVLVARGALGNPWIFKRMKLFLETGELAVAVNREEVARVMREHFRLYTTFFEERLSIVKFYNFFMWYTKFFPRARTFRRKLMYVKTAKQMLEIIQEFSDS
ncbi:MAG: tRNA dihydrouridine synthase DusB [Candidatus Omnitrophica bacterium]|nr:tRNA dihydrouridine synthase DusB [Candidatus Omnitrophota bacterium]